MLDGVLDGVLGLGGELDGDLGEAISRADVADDLDNHGDRQGHRRTRQHEGPVWSSLKRLPKMYFEDRCARRPDQPRRDRSAGEPGWFWRR